MRLLVFHPIIAPYRIDFFNKLNAEFEACFCLSKRNLSSQKFNYKEIEKQFDFTPNYIDRRTCGIPRGVFSTIRTFNPDIVMVSECGIISILVVLFKILLGKKYRIISIVDDSYNMVAENNQFSKKHEIAEKVLFPYFHEIINVEPRVASHFQNIYKKGIYFPIIVDENKSREKYQRILPISESLVTKYDLKDKKVLLFVGRLVELKNLQMVIPAFKRLNDKNARFVIVGSGEYESNLRELAKSDDRIIFVGRKEGDELYAWYNIAQCFVLASYQEAFGAVTNEALLGGCWALISNKAGSQCLIKNGENGQTFNPDDQLGFTKLLEESMSKTQRINLPLKMRVNLMPLDFESTIQKVIDKISNK